MSEDKTWKQSVSNFQFSAGMKHSLRDINVSLVFRRQIYERIPEYILEVGKTHVGCYSWSTLTLHSILSDLKVASWNIIIIYVIIILLILCIRWSKYKLIYDVSDQ